MCTFFLPSLVKKNTTPFIPRTSIIVLFIKRLVKKEEKHSDSAWGSPGSGRRAAAAAAAVWLRRGPSPSKAPRRLNASNHLSDLIRGGMNRAVLINADLDGWIDGWMDPPSLPPSLAPSLLLLLHQFHHHHHQWGDEYYYTLTASNQLMAG